MSVVEVERSLVNWARAVFVALNSDTIRQFDVQSNHEPYSFDITYNTERQRVRLMAIDRLAESYDESRIVDFELPVWLLLETKNEEGIH